MKRCFILLFALAILAGCGEQLYQKTGNGVVVQLKSSAKTGAKQVRLEVINDNIIRVSATASDSFSDRESLSVLAQTGVPQWTVDTQNDTLVLKTKVVTALLCLADGQVVFKDSLGNILLSELKGGGKTFEAVTLEGKPFFKVHQVFDSPADEAFFGLGQHQDGQMNYKGQDVDLFQYNSKVSVPVVVSSKNYGVLWDNYSRSKFGDIRDYSPLSQLVLFDKMGKKGGLTASYMRKDGKSVLVSRVENSIYYETIPDLAKLPEGAALKDCNVTWEGDFEAKESGVHKFRMYSAGYAKLWIDGKLIADRWRQCWNPTSDLFRLDLVKGEKHNIRIEWDPDGGESYFSLDLKTPIDAVSQNQLSLYSECAHEIDYYFIAGQNADEIVKGYRTLTGKAPIMPKWMYGFWQSRERYKTQDELLNAVKEYRKRQIPLDNIVLDWQYWPDDKWGSHDFDSIRFPDPKGMIDQVHALNTHIMISVWPKFYTGNDNFEKMNAKGYLFQRNLEMKHKDWVGPGYYNTFYDVFNPGARQMFWDLMNDKLFSKGIDAWWMDASEPDMHSNLSIETRKELMSPTYLGPGAEYFNAYPLENARSIFEGQTTVAPNQRVFILTRSAFTGQQRYAAATWSGDIGTTWHDMKAQIAAGANFCISGIPYWTMDIGGFASQKRFEKPNAADLDEWKEQNIRWHEFGAFCPIYRSHGQFPYREIYEISAEGTPAYKALVSIDQLRYRLLPYMYSLAARTHFDDYTIMRPLVMDNGNDPAVFNITDQYMLGSSFLVAPITSYKARSRMVYLPKGKSWYN
ncbi:MAG: hypothetical protein RIS47_2077, partial [Bacteroidota bacterium]